MGKYITKRQRRELRAKKRKRIVLVLAVTAVLCLAGMTVSFAVRHSGARLSKTDKYGSESLVYSDAESIPDYSGKDYIVLGGGKPNFNEWDLENISGEHYSELDSLGRCGTAYAMLDRTMLPTEERGEIGQVRPSGWKQAKYEGYVESDPPYLYNRCHLIAYALTGQNANERNLITGTRHFNTAAMLPFESQVMRYLDDSDNHVLYRVTPYFRDRELVARGVEMEAYSVEDHGAGVCFHVFVYNCQPGIGIDYRTGESWIA